MINIFNTATAHLYGDQYPELLRCRYREFIGNHKYDVPSYNQMEYDQYDTPATVYFTWKDGDSRLRAGLRVLPTNRPYMIRDLWPTAVQCVPMPNSPTIWEASRLFIDREMEPDLRERAHGELLCAMLEFGIQYRLKGYIAVAHPDLWEHTFGRYEWPANIVGPILNIGPCEHIQPCLMHVSYNVLTAVRSVARISDSVVQSSIFSAHKAELVEMEALARD